MNPMGFMPFPFWHQQSEPREVQDSVPPRIRMAMEYLQHVTNKTMQRVAISKYGIEKLDKEKLTTAESNCQATACNILVDYFNGKLKPDRFEKMENRVEVNMVEGVDVRVPSGSALLVRCFGCAPNVKKDCQFCKGTGELLVYPTVSQQ